jgi:hypothetical protein
VSSARHPLGPSTAICIAHSVMVSPAAIAGMPTPTRSLPEIEMGHGDREVATERKSCVECPTVILIDSDVPMYLVGVPDPHKSDAQRLLEKLVNERRRLVSDAEVLQEISPLLRDGQNPFSRSSQTKVNQFSS